jgi:hypothetical protein
MQHLSDDEVHLITASAEKNLSEQLNALDDAKTYPLDMVIYFCPHLAEEGAHRKTDIPVVAGFGSRKCPTLTLSIPPPASAMDQPQTWWYFLDALGCPIPKPENPS